MYWNDLNTALKERYGTKVYKLALSSGCSCPNRDGTLGERGCIFCDGAGAFAAAGDIDAQIAAAKERVAAKAGEGAKYIAYFQSFTNTYGDVEQLETLFGRAIAGEDIVALSIATRPDCLGEEVMAM
ncbi:MAG: TIGR01212 family radical SAM protein, partial [Oscillibacter sp.]|nr:TIGR01212 family radical SAM protein [Oscillibacter sp.]